VVPNVLIFGIRECAFGSICPIWRAISGTAAICADLPLTIAAVHAAVGRFQSLVQAAANRRADFLRAGFPCYQLADSHIFERAPGLGDAEEVFHAAPHGYGAWLGSRVAVPPAEPGDDPSGPGEAFGWMRVGLQRCPAPVFRSERGEKLDLLLVEGATGRL